MELRLKELRKEYGYTQAYVARYLFVCPKTYSSYEKGQIAIPLESLAKIAELYDTSVDYIMYLTDDDFPHARKK
ncbi:MAG: helix-turn-helix domain-containing protein [Clostridia bacterium]|nr:helix-turn-helix domain-containing protein [Clostridia bacterium]